MRKIGFAILLCLSTIALPFTSQAEHSTVLSRQAMAALENDKRAIDLAAATIRSRAQLDQHLTTNLTSPMDRIPEAARRTFLDSLVFTDWGLGSYSYEPLAANLSPTEIYQILSLFGVQSSIGAIPELVAQNPTERAMLRPLQYPDKRDAACYSGDQWTYCQVAKGAVCPLICDTPNP
jgi:hypothetical protein